MQYEIEITVYAQTPEIAEQIGNALKEIKNQLSDSDLIELAKILKTNRGIVKKAKLFFGKK